MIRKNPSISYCRKTLLITFSRTPSKKLNERDLKEREFAQSKVNISNIYNKNENYKPISKSGSVKDSAKRNEQLSKQFRKLVEDSLVCDLDNLKQLAWCGVPQGIILIKTN